MIVFYNKETGSIEGTINGRIHQEEELKMSMGDPKTTAKIVVQWKPSEWGIDTKGKRVATKFFPDTNQPDIFIEADKNPLSIYDYILKNGKLVKK